MNKQDKEVIISQLQKEKATLENLKNTYRTALDDVDDKLAILIAKNDIENLQSQIYQIKYQKQLKEQLENILDNLNTKQYETISEYLQNCYNDNFVGTLYSIQSQGVPVVFPINQDQIAQAIEHDTKLSKPLYDTLKENTDNLKNEIRQSISVGLAQGSSYADISSRLAQKMVGDYSKFNGGAYYKASTITRTEGNRIANKSRYDVMQKAKSMGVIQHKKWDSTLDGRTRESHFAVDGEIVEMDDKFSNGLLMPLDKNGKASEVVNCRCCLLSVSKWDIYADDNTKWLGDTSNLSDERKQAIADKLGIDISELDNFSKQLVEIKADSLKDFKKNYAETIENIEKQEYNKHDIYNLSQYKRITDNEISDWKKYAGKSTQDEYKQINKHHKTDGSKGGYVRSHRAWEFNAELREGKENLLDADDKKTLETIRKLCRDNATDRPVILDRFVGSDYLSEYNGFFNEVREDLVDEVLNFVNNNMIGTNKTEKSIVSASYGANVLTNRPVHVKLHCPKDTHLFVTKNKRESEVLFHDGLTYEIVSASKETYKGLFGDKFRLVLNVVVKNNGL